MPLRLYRRKEVYWLRGTVAGRRIHRSTGTADKGIAERIRAEAEAREWKRSLDGPGAVLSFAQAVMLYLDAQKSDRFLAPLVAHWKDTLVKDITAGDIRQSAVKLYPKASPATRNRQAVVPARAVINHAADMGLCPHIRVARFKEQKTVRPIGSLEWVEAFAVAASPELGSMAWFLFLTGARITQACNLTWADVDLANGVAVLRKPKGQSDQRAHLPAALVARLANLECGKEPWRKVFGMPSRHFVYKRWRATCKRAGIPYITPHPAGRHAFATGLLRAGVDVKTVAHLGHWKSERLVLETYAHAIEDRTLTERLLTPPVHRDLAKRLK